MWVSGLRVAGHGLKVAKDNARVAQSTADQQRQTGGQAGRQAAMRAPPQSCRAPSAGRHGVRAGTRWSACAPVGTGQRGWDSQPFCRFERFEPAAEVGVDWEAAGQGGWHTLWARGWQQGRVPGDGHDVAGCKLACLPKMQHGKVGYVSAPRHLPHAAAAAAATHYCDAFLFRNCRSAAQPSSTAAATSRQRRPGLVTIPFGSGHEGEQCGDRQHGCRGGRGRGARCGCRRCPAALHPTPLLPADPALHASAGQSRQSLCVSWRE